MNLSLLMVEGKLCRRCKTTYGVSWLKSCPQCSGVVVPVLFNVVRFIFKQQWRRHKYPYVTLLVLILLLGVAYLTLLIGAR